MFARPQDFFGFIAPLRLSLVFMTIALLSTLIKSSKPNIFKLLKTRQYFYFYLVMIIGIPFAYHRRVAFEFIFTIYSANIILFYLMTVHLRTVKSIKLFLSVICVSALFYGAMSLYKGQFTEEGRFYVSEMYDPNDLAYFFVSMLPFFFIFMKKGERKVTRVAAWSGCAVSVINVLFSASRGGMIGLIIIIPYIIFGKSIIVKKSTKVFVLAVLLLSIGLNTDKINFDRFKTLDSIESDYNMTDETGRLALWRRAWGIALDYPFTGVGPWCSPMAIGYQRMEEGKPPIWQPIHNSYIQVLTETGFIGFLFYFFLIKGSIKTFYRVERCGDKSDGFRYFKLIAGVAKPAFFGSLVCAFFLTQAYSGIFTLFFGLAAVLDNQLESVEGNSKVKKNILNKGDSR
jgi:putative inorganic carbon (hco3(-)) transporter